jgi:hypothetical protein
MILDFLFSFFFSTAFFAAWLGVYGSVLYIRSYVPAHVDKRWNRASSSPNVHI